MITVPSPASTRKNRFSCAGAAAAVVVLMGVSAPIAHAEPTTDAFLRALEDAGVSYSDPTTAASLGQSICPLLKEPGGSFARAAASVTDTNGISPDMAALFTTIAISMYCPSMVGSIMNGDLLGQFSL